MPAHGGLDFQLAAVVDNDFVNDGQTEAGSRSALQVSILSSASASVSNQWTFRRSRVGA